MFKKILIANRGEITSRIIRTAKKIGIQTVAIYSTVDKNHAYVNEADEAYWVGEAEASQSYLNIAAILKIAQHAKVDAIHPGYGFLAENAKFVQACNQVNITFIGPSKDVVDIMGSKQLCKQFLEKTTIPLIPGYHGNIQTEDKLMQEARKIGYPLLLKAANGGGGKGLKTVVNEHEFGNALKSAKREALLSFGDDKIIIEKLLLHPRHIEVQILADNYGNIIHLYDRDCSIQRRHQKIIEEAPALNLNENLRTNMLNDACKIAKLINYSSVGTIEFMVANNQYYFMEMNTRLQVEHPVTEIITNLDLVEWQLRIAAKEKLTITQNQVKVLGHAIECRICAEDPEHNFMPSLGQIDFLQEPLLENIRIDSGVAIYTPITPYYDSLLAKLIAWGNSKEEAINQLIRGLDAYIIHGVKTNLTYLKAICQTKNFQTGKFDINFLTTEKITYTLPDINFATILAASYDYLTLTTALTDPLLQDTFGWQIHNQTQWQWKYLICKQQKIAHIFPNNLKKFKIIVDENLMQNTYLVEGSFLNNELKLIINQQKYSAIIYETVAHIMIYHPNGDILVERYHLADIAKPTLLDVNSVTNFITAPMSGTVIAILKNQGDLVKKDEQIMILEAMKMEHAIKATQDGVLLELFYAIGAKVQEGTKLLTIHPE